MKNRGNKQWKKWVRVGLAVVLVLDVLLLYANWRAQGAGPRQQVAQRDRLREEEKLFGADMRRVAAIRDRLSDVQHEAGRFYADEFLSAASGYSTVTADLGKISTSAGLRASNLAFKERPLDSRGVTEITVSATVEGEYVNLVRFINGLERSENFYLLESLSLASSTGGNIKLNLQLRTYFRAS